MYLIEQLKEALPKGREFNVLYVRSEPKECHDIVKHNRRYSRFSKPQLTVKIKHFLLIFDKPNDVMLFGIEVYNYLSIGNKPDFASGVSDENVQHLFVSKIDTTGLIDIKININRIISIFLSHLITCINVNSMFQLTYRVKKSDDLSTGSTLKRINKLLNPNTTSIYKTVPLTNKFRTKISLFTKSSNQYFFPNSDKNEFKHLINGDQLLNWWLKLLNNMIQDLLKDRKVLFQQKLLIPGSMNYNKKYLFGNWEVGSIFQSNDDDMAIYNIPNFPDDPKTRFLEFLVIENRYRVNLLQFYEELGFRQEFRLGNVVGIIGCELEVYEMGASNDNSTVVELTNRKYKKLMNLIKSEDFHVLDDIKSLLTLKLPFFLKLCNQSSRFHTVTGNFVHEGSKTSNNVQVNNLTGLVKRKKK